MSASEAWSPSLDSKIRMKRSAEKNVSSCPSRNLHLTLAQRNPLNPQSKFVKGKTDINTMKSLEIIVRVLMGLKTFLSKGSSNAQILPAFLPHLEVPHKRDDDK